MKPGSNQRLARSWMLFALVQVLCTTLFPWAGCKNASECSEQVECPLGSTCVQGICQERRCATSAQCGMEQFCENGSCVDGCAADEDCYPGDACNTDIASCEAAECADSHRDCAFKEFCNLATGDCYEATGYYCAACADDSDCGAEENLCYYGYCLVSCQSNEDCPSGFDCVPFVDYAGNVQSYQCYTICWLYDDYDGLFSATSPGVAEAGSRPGPLPGYSPSGASAIRGDAP